MSLRLRLVLVTVLTAAPVIGLVAWVQEAMARRAMDDALVEFVTSRMEGGGREMCEAYPETWPSPPPMSRRRGMRGGPMARRGGGGMGGQRR